MMPIVFGVMMVFFPAGIWCCTGWSTAASACCSSGTCCASTPTAPAKEAEPRRHGARGPRALPPAGIRARLGTERPARCRVTARDSTIAAIATAAGAAGHRHRLSGPRAREIATALCGRALRPRHALRALPRRRRQRDRRRYRAALRRRRATGEDVVELQAHGSPPVLRQLLARCARRADGAAGGVQRARLPQRPPGPGPGRGGGRPDRRGRPARGARGQAFARRRVLRPGRGDCRRPARDPGPGGSRDRLRRRTARHPRRRGPAPAPGRGARTAARPARRGRARAPAARRPARGAGRSAQRRQGRCSTRSPAANGRSSPRSPAPPATCCRNAALDGRTDLVDTAGLREDGDAIEREGMRRARADLARADLALVVLDARDPEAGLRARDADLDPVPGRIVLHNKADLLAAGAGAPDDGALRVSALTGAGLDALRARLREAAAAIAPGEGGFSARLRHVQALERTAAACAQAAATGRASSSSWRPSTWLAHDALAITGRTLPERPAGPYLLHASASAGSGGAPWSSGKPRHSLPASPRRLAGHGRSVDNVAASRPRCAAPPSPGKTECPPPPPRPAGGCRRVCHRRARAGTRAWPCCWRAASRTRPPRPATPSTPAAGEPAQAPAEAPAEAVSAESPRWTPSMREAASRPTRRAGCTRPAATTRWSTTRCATAAGRRRRVQRAGRPAAMTVIATEQSRDRGDFAEAKRLLALIEKTDSSYPAIERLRNTIASAEAGGAACGPGAAPHRRTGGAAPARARAQRQEQQRGPGTGSARTGRAAGRRKRRRARSRTARRPRARAAGRDREAERLESNAARPRPRAAPRRGHRAA